MRGFVVGILVCGFVGALLWGVTSAQTSDARDHVEFPTDLRVIAMPSSAADIQQELIVVDARNRPGRTRTRRAASRCAD